MIAQPARVFAYRVVGCDRTHPEEVATGDDVIEAPLGGPARDPER
jgi:hypothetical protein